MRRLCRVEPHMDVAAMVRRLAAVGMVAALALTASCASASDGSGAPGVKVNAPSSTSGYHGTTLAKPYTLPAVTLTDERGEPFNLAKDTNKPLTLVFFGYTNCPDICPTTVAGLTQALRRVPPEVRQQVSFVFITTDPARDTSARLSEWLGRFDDSYTGLTGSLATIKKVASQLGVGMTGKKRLPSGGYEVGHGSQVIAFGTNNKARLVWTGGTAVAAYEQDITKLAKTRT